MTSLIGRKCCGRWSAGADLDSKRERRASPALSSAMTSPFATGVRVIVLSIAFSIALVPASGDAATLTVEQQRILLRSGRVDGDVVLAAAAEENVRVMVALATPPTRGQATADRLDAIATTIDSVLGTLPPDQFKLRHRFRYSAVFSGSIGSAGLLALVGHPLVVRIDLDGGGGGALAEAVPLVGLDVVQAMGFTGAGITVAILDTGIDLDHLDLVDSIVGEHCICPACCPNGSSVQDGPGSGEDDNGHGTHVAGIVTSRGIVAPLGGAPDADIVIVKVLDQSNSFSCVSDVVAGLEWIIDQRPDVDVVNLSLGTNVLYPGNCDAADADTMAFAGAIDTLTSLGVVVLAASRNDGSETEMSAPACIANAISVAASDDLDEVYAQSNTNAQTDLLAPGVDIQSTGVADGTAVWTGTSQAVALSSACVAALLEAVPSATTSQIRSALVSSPTTIVDPKNGLDFSRLDCADALVALPEPDRVWSLCAALGALAALAPRSRRNSARRFDSR